MLKLEQSTVLFLCFFLALLVVELQGLVLARQVLYHFSLTSSLHITFKRKKKSSSESII
jgi:hypothetical protein